MLGEDIAEDKVNSIAERIIFEADKSGQGKISFEDFCIALERTDVKHKMSIRYLGWMYSSVRDVKMTKPQLGSFFLFLIIWLCSITM